MTDQNNAIYEGTVMHRRLRPARHDFRYHVFSILVDLDSIEALSSRLKLFSLNRRNLISLHLSDHGDGENLRLHLDRLSSGAVGPGTVTRYLMLCYPRVLGFAFNPLTVYYGLDEADRVAVVHYEVNNTFGGRHTYALANHNEQDVIRQDADKTFYVSPFNDVSGRYVFRTRRPAEAASVSIILEDEKGPMFSAGFAGKRRQLDDRELLRQIVRNSLITYKVWTGIHWEALKLWLKGLKIHARPGAAKGGGLAVSIRSLVPDVFRFSALLKDKSADQPEI